MSVIEHDQYLEELQMFLVKNEIDLDSVKYDLADDLYFHIFEGLVDVYTEPDNSYEQYVKEIQFLPAKYNEHFALMKKEFEKVDLGSSMDYLDYEITEIK